MAVMRQAFVTFCTLVISHPLIDAAKILFMPTQMSSLVHTSNGIAGALAERGHHVHMGMSDQFMQTSKITVPHGVKIMQYKVPPAEFDLSPESISEFTYGTLMGQPQSIWEIFEFAANIELPSCSAMMEDEDFLAKIKQEKFDLIVTDIYSSLPCLLILPAHFNIPFAAVGVEAMPDILRLPFLPSFVGNFYNMYGDKMTFWERLHNVYLHIMYAMYVPVQLPGDNLLKKYGAPRFQNMSWKEMARQAEVVIYPRHWITDWPEPMMPHVVQVPGIVHAAKPLSTEFQGIMDSSKDGVIIVTFGSMLAILPDEIFDKFLESFSRIKQTVIWRVLNSVEGKAVSENVHISPWLPQTDLLAHPKTRLFITHGGKGGQMEAVTHGVPMLAFPHLDDQFRNAKAMADIGLGLSMDVIKFTPDELVNAINEILSNPVYSQNTKKRAAILGDLPLNSRETSVYWIEHVIKFGGSHLRSHALDMPWFAFYMFDIFVCVMAVVLFALITLVFIGRKCWCNKKKEKPKHD